jgi:F0F1-type ATP synthase assembly protein I
MNLRAIREVNTGFGDGLAAAFEMVATPVIFAFIGHLLDDRFGTGRVFLLSFGLLVFGYMIWKLVARYSAEMDAHQAAGPWSRSTSTSTSTSTPATSTPATSTPAPSTPPASSPKTSPRADTP